jgi:transposase-like protein
MKQYLQWKEKLNIINEAYSIKGNIMATARKCSISPAQIRRWMKQKAALADKLDHIGHLKMVQKGRPAQNEQAFDALRSYIHQLECQGRAITVGMICRELKRIEPSEAEISLAILRQRVYRFLEKEKLVQRRATYSTFTRIKVVSS